MITLFLFSTFIFHHSLSLSSIGRPVFNTHTVATRLIQNVNFEWMKMLKYFNNTCAIKISFGSDEFKWWGYMITQRVFYFAIRQKWSGRIINFIYLSDIWLIKWRRRNYFGEMRNKIKWRSFNIASKIKWHQTNYNVLKASRMPTS